MIGIIDYGLGNLASVKNMIKKVGGDAIISADVNELSECEKLILPGVGAFGQGMQNLKDKGLDRYVKEEAQNGKKILGICLGAQLLTSHSEEGNVEGLDLIKAETRKFVLSDPKLKVPHMGWFQVDFKQMQHPLFDGLSNDQRYYFVHSYYMDCSSEEDVLCSCDYEITFAAGIAKGNIAGVQFHPEKSHVFGMKLMSNFLNW